MTKARGQISFVDLNDGKSIMASLDTNQSPTQIHNVDAPAYNAEHDYDEGDAGYEATFIPDYTESPYLVVSPVIFVSGMSGNQVSSLARTPYWTINGVAVNGSAAGARNTRAQTGGVDNFPAAKVIFSTTAPYTLTIKSNEYMEEGVLDIRCQMEYLDDQTGLETPLSARTSIQQLSVAMGTLSAAIYSMSGTKSFVNKDIVSNSNIVLHCDMYRGGHIDNEDVDYAWFRHDNPDDASDDYAWYKIVSAVPTSDPTYDANDHSIIDPVLGKVGYWVKDSTIVIKDDDGTVNISGNNITITPDAVTNYDAFMCTCKDTDSESSSTYGVSIGTVPIDITDYTDPISIEFYTPAGTSLVRGQDSLDATVQIFMDGVQFTTAQYNACTFTWVKRKKDGTLATGTGTPASDYKENYKWKRNAQQELVVDDTDTSDRTAWHISDGTYCRIALGSKGGRNLTVYRDEINLKGTFDVEVDIDLT